MYVCILYLNIYILYVRMYVCMLVCILYLNIYCMYLRTYVCMNLTKYTCLVYIVTKHHCVFLRHRVLKIPHGKLVEEDNKVVSFYKIAFPENRAEETAIDCGIENPTYGVVTSGKMFE